MPRTLPPTTLVDIVLGDISELRVFKGASGMEVQVWYDVRDDADNRHHSGDIVKIPDAASVTALKNWVDIHFLPDINTQEGMS